jgi:hypothetical protein
VILLGLGRCTTTAATLVCGHPLAALLVCALLRLAARGWARRRLLLPCAGLCLVALLLLLGLLTLRAALRLRTDRCRRRIGWWIVLAARLVRILELRIWLELGLVVVTVSLVVLLPALLFGCRRLGIGRTVLRTVRMRLGGRGLIGGALRRLPAGRCLRTCGRRLRTTGLRSALRAVAGACSSRRWRLVASAFRRRARTAAGVHGRRTATARRDEDLRLALARHARVELELHGRLLHSAAAA